MITRQSLVAGALGVVAAAALASAQPPVAAVDVGTIGPQVGATVPPLAGTDQFGKAQTLASLSGPKGLMLVFSRSADW